MTVREAFDFVFEAWKHPVQTLLVAGLFGVLGVLMGHLFVAQWHLFER